MNTSKASNHKKFLIKHQILIPSDKKTLENLYCYVRQGIPGDPKTQTSRIRKVRTLQTLVGKHVHLKNSEQEGEIRFITTTTKKEREQNPAYTFRAGVQWPYPHTIFLYPLEQLIVINDSNQ